MVAIDTKVHSKKENLVVKDTVSLFGTTEKFITAIIKKIKVMALEFNIIQPAVFILVIGIKTTKKETELQ